MTKKISEPQDFGFIGEADFQSWATKMGYYPTKLIPDIGIDFACQLKGKKSATGTTWDVTSKNFVVAVRSTEEDGEEVRITKDDAEVLLNSNVPIVLALVRRAPTDKAPEVSLRFVDEDFVRELHSFLRESSETRTIKFSDAIRD